MSTPAPPRSSVLQSTQQQLDELDALIQRMLVLPANPLEELPVSAPASLATTLAPEPSTYREPDAFPEHARSEPAPAALADQTQEKNLWTELAATASPWEKAVPTSEPQPTSPAAELPETSLPVAEPLTEGPRPGEVPTAVALPPGAQPVPAPLSLNLAKLTPRAGAYLATGRTFLIRWNRVYDRWTFPLGRPGRWLRSLTGRDTLGWTGVALVVGAVLWGVLDWLGWIW